MKLFLKREISDSETGFSVLSESAELLYTVNIHTDKTRQKLTITDSNGKTVSEIIHKNLVVEYFAVKTTGRIFILVPLVKDCFTFIIYGSTFRFAGDLSSGRFSLIDVDKSPIMTQKKCWGKFGDGYELKIYDTDQQLFSISCAVCAALYLSAAQTSTAAT